MSGDERLYGSEAARSVSAVFYCLRTELVTKKLDEHLGVLSNGQVQADFQRLTATGSRLPGQEVRLLGGLDASRDGDPRSDEREKKRCGLNSATRRMDPET
jgi:hypothetical protein